MSRKVFSNMVHFQFDGLLSGKPDERCLCSWFAAIKNATIALSNGKVFNMGIKNLGKENIYIWPVKLNGKPYSKIYITHRQ
jgi:putative alpha-1,2-mannosidase